MSRDPELCSEEVENWEWLGEKMRAVQEGHKYVAKGCRYRICNPSAGEEIRMCLENRIGATGSCKGQNKGINAFNRLNMGMNLQVISHS